MNHVCRPLLGLVSAAALVVCLGAAAYHDNDKESASLSYKAYPKWTINLPKETFTPIANQIPLSHANGAGFLATLDGPSLAIDSNADGKVDVKAKGAAGFVTLKGDNADGNAFVYAVRLVNSGGWSYAAGGAMVGKVKGETVRLIDQNNNGTYNDFGADAIVVGSGDAASFLSKVVNLSGGLYELEVNADGTHIAVSPFQGEAGTVNLRQKFESQGTLESAILASEDGMISFNVADDKKGLLVPAGEYRLVHGQVSVGAESAKVKAGRMRPVVVSADQVTTPAWGGPLKAEFSYTHENGKLTIRPQDLFFFGNAGEEYYNWIPDGAPPKFVVKDAKSGNEILTARFGGC